MIWYSVDERLWRASLESSAYAVLAVEALNQNISRQE
jgi:hypothetical protein